MAGTGYSSTSGGDQDVMVASLQKNSKKNAGTSPFKAGRVHPSSGGWTTSDSEGPSVNVNCYRYATILL
jgi:hypothetical protein